MSIVPFAEDHLDAAATLLAARHQRDRTRAPDLAAAYEDAAAARQVLQDLLPADGMGGVVALDGGRLVGYLLGAPDLGSPTHPFAGFMHPRSADIPYAGHATNPEDGPTVYPRLYAALARQWVRDGIVGHYITVPADGDAIQTWSDLGFGRFVALGVRATTALAEHRAPRAVHLDVRRATAEDETAVDGLVAEFFRSVADPPIFLPFLPETAAERRRWVAEHLADPACPIWLAFVDGRPAGLQLFEEPTSHHWHQSPLQTPPRAVYLQIASTAPEARSAGIGAALLQRTMAWARDAGYAYCTAHWLTASRAASFWQGLGLQPVSYWLHRSIDERAIWADGRS